MFMFVIIITIILALIYLCCGIRKCITKRVLYDYPESHYRWIHRQPAAPLIRHHHNPPISASNQPSGKKVISSVGWCIVPIPLNKGLGVESLNRTHAPFSRISSPPPPHTPPSLFSISCYLES